MWPVPSLLNSLSKHLLGVQHQGEWSVVQQLDLHVGAEAAVLDGRHVLPAFGHEILVERIGLLRGTDIGARPREEIINKI